MRAAIVKSTPDARDGDDQHKLELTDMAEDMPIDEPFWT
jgi:hypothetical protein